MDLKGSLQLLSVSHLRERERGLLRGILSGGVWNGCLLGHAQGEIVPCRFCGEADGDGHFFWDCTHPLFVHIRENPEFLRTNVQGQEYLACMAGYLPWLLLVVTLLGRFLNKILLIISLTAPMRLILMLSCMT